MNIEQAIFEIRKRLDEIEELAKILPKTERKSLWLTIDGWSASGKLKDVFDSLKIPNKPSIRKKLIMAVRLLAEGVAPDEIAGHRRMSRAIAVKPYLDEFLKRLIASEQRAEPK